MQFECSTVLPQLKKRTQTPEFDVHIMNAIFAWSDQVVKSILVSKVVIVQTEQGSNQKCLC